MHLTNRQRVGAHILEHQNDSPVLDSSAQGWAASLAGGRCLPYFLETDDQYPYREDSALFVAMLSETPGHFVVPSTMQAWRQGQLGRARIQTLELHSLAPKLVLRCPTELLPNGHPERCLGAVSSPRPSPLELDLGGLEAAQRLAAPPPKNASTIGGHHLAQWRDAHPVRDASLEALEALSLYRAA